MSSEQFNTSLNDVDTSAQIIQIILRRSRMMKWKHEADLDDDEQFVESIDFLE